MSQRSRQKIVKLAAPLGAPNKGDTAQLQMSPRTPSGMPTTGLRIKLTRPGVGAATEGVGGFEVTPWIQNPTNGEYGSGATFNAFYNQEFVTFDFNAVDLSFEIGNVGVAGSVELNWVEE